MTYRNPLRILAAGLVLYGFSAGASAAPCTSTTNWGSLGPPDTQFFGNDFGSTGNKSDCYTFSLSGNSNAFGGVIEVDVLSRLDIDVTSVSLFSGGVSGGNTTGSLIETDNSPLLFDFDGLAAGIYSFVVSAIVSTGSGWDDWLKTDVGYTGNITTVRAHNVPEPGALTLLGLGLVGLGLQARRRSTARSAA